MKKELVILNELESLFKEGRPYTIKYKNIEEKYCFDGHSGMLTIEIDYTEEELVFIKNTIRNKFINGYGMLINVPTIDIEGNKIDKCFMISFILENLICNYDLSENNNI